MNVFKWKTEAKKVMWNSANLPMLDLVIHRGNFGIKCKYRIYSYPYRERLLRDTQEESF